VSAIVDTNVYVYYAIKSSKYHKRSKELLNKLSKWGTPTVVVHEVIWTLYELLGRERTLYFVKALLSHRKTEVIPVSKQDITWSLEKIIEEKISLTRYNDKVILSLAKRTNTPILSFDKQLLAQAVRNGVAVINPYIV